MVLYVVKITVTEYFSTSMYMFMYSIIYIYKLYLYRIQNTNDPPLIYILFCI